MRRLILYLLLVLLLAKPVHAMSYEAPVAPESAQMYMPENEENLGSGLWFVLKSAINVIMPNVRECAATCLSIIATVMLLSMVQNLSTSAKKITPLLGAVAIGTIVFQSANALVNLGSDTVMEIIEYGKLLLPVMAAALSAQGGISTATALYSGTMVFSSILSSLISGIVIPLTYIYFVLSVGSAATHSDTLKGLKDLAKWLSTWVIKIVLYVSIGYLSVTGVISGSVDSSAIKATKLAISGAVPVVGGILSDASETILISAGLMKNAAGVYGLITFFAVTIGPFLRISVHCLLLKLTSAVCGVLGEKKTSSLVKDISNIMGMVLAMTGTACLLFLISTVCFMRGIT